MGIGETYQSRAASPRHRRHLTLVSYSTTAGACMPFGHKKKPTLANGQTVMNTAAMQMELGQHYVINRQKYNLSVPSTP